jgi:DMSO/TMAO reductase YedYZ molybdopterin-dependent catalytic subunit
MVKDNVMENSSMFSGARRGDRLARGKELPLVENATQAGAVAALAMLAVQLLWRLMGSSTGVQAFPELVVAALARLTPLGVFGFATETFGSLAQNTLFVAVMIGIVAVGAEAGGIAGSLAERGELRRRRFRRIISGLFVAGTLWLFVSAAILPVANLGFFGRDTRHQAEILFQLVATFGLYGITWAWLTTPRRTVPGATSTEALVSRRDTLRQAVVGGGAMALLTGVGLMSWRLMRSPSSGDRAASEEAAKRILANARARSAASGAGEAGSKDSAQGAVGEQPPAAKSLTSETPAAGGNRGTPSAGGTFAALDAAGHLTPALTSVSDFYHVSKNISDPTVDGDGWTLTVTGLVDQPLKLTYEDLASRATTRKITTLCCISNELNGDLISTAEWQGLPLRDLLKQAGVKSSVVDLKFHAADDYEDSIPLARGLDPDTLLVVGMNGEPLPPDHGYPARVIVPGIYGMKNVKWLERIEAVDEDFKGYWQTRGWSDPAPNQIWGRIDFPGGGDDLASGPAVAAGVASAGDRGVQLVEVSLDDGSSWRDALLETPLNPPFTWVRWALPFDARPGKHQMVVRITDGTGTVASEEPRPPLPDGATGWPRRTVNVKS